jgi:uncharacterized protein
MFSKTIKKWVKEQFDFNKSQFVLYAVGCLLFSFGAKFFIDTKLGTDPLDVLVLGIVKHTGLAIGTVSGGITIAFLILWCVWNKKLPLIMPFITMSAVGYLIDLWNYLHIETYTTAILSPYPLLISALILAGFASSLIVMSGIGIRIMDLVAITIVEKCSWKFFYAKMLFEIGFALSGWVLGGPLGIGSILFLCVVGPTMVMFMSLNERYLKIHNYGLKSMLNTAA